MNTDLALSSATLTDVTAATYNSAADHFDDLALGFWDRCGRRTVERLSLAPGARVLDVGCGTGASALHAARVVGPRGRVVGVDLAEGLLRQARRKANAQGLTNAEFRAGDMTRLGFGAATFDVVICVFAIFFVEDMVAQVARLWRMLRPGGQLAITTWGPDLFEPARSGFWAAIRAHRPDLERRYSPWDQLTNPASLRQLFRAAGVAVPDIFVHEDSQPLESLDDWWTIACGTGYRWTIDQLTAREAVLIRAENLRLLRECGAKSVATSSLCAVARKKAAPSTTAASFTRERP